MPTPALRLDEPKLKSAHGGIYWPTNLEINGYPTWSTQTTQTGQSTNVIYTTSYGTWAITDPEHASDESSCNYFITEFPHKGSMPHEFMWGKMEGRLVHWELYPGRVRELDYASYQDTFPLRNTGEVTGEPEAWVWGAAERAFALCSSRDACTMKVLQLLHPAPGSFPVLAKNWLVDCEDRIRAMRLFTLEDLAWRDANAFADPSSCPWPPGLCDLLVTVGALLRRVFSFKVYPYAPGTCELTEMPLMAVCKHASKLVKNTRPHTHTQCTRTYRSQRRFRTEKYFQKC